MISVLFTVLGQAAAANTKTTVVTLYNNGTAIDTAMFPKCIVGERIDLLSYKYISRHCSVESACYLPLSATAEVLLHEMCSLQEACSDFTFPVSDIGGKQLKGVSIEYECLGKPINLKSFKGNSEIRIDS